MRPSVPVCPATRAKLSAAVGQAKRPIRACWSRHTVHMRAQAPLRTAPAGRRKTLDLTASRIEAGLAKEPAVLEIQQLTLTTA